ncbi:MAG: preprotein translocase subunit SecA [Candidatus Paceibacterota bacterium]
MNFFTKLFGNKNEELVSKVLPLVERINSLESGLIKLSDLELKNKTQEFRSRLKDGQSLDEILPEAFAVVRETSKRTLKKRHFDCQLIGGIFLHRGHVVEMKTGEGKTLTATLAMYLNALEGKGAHLVTVNDYLARRDAVWMGQIYNFLGLTVSCLNNEQTFIYDPEYKKPEENKENLRDELGGFYVVEDYLRPCSKKEAYGCDITYGTNNEFGFDYLRDNMIYDCSEALAQNFNFAIVDEVDSILIDEARTPLIISGVLPEAPEGYYKFAKVAKDLVKPSDYEIDEKSKSLKFTQSGEDNVTRILGFDPWQEVDFKTIHRLENALKAKEFHRLDREYVVRNNEIVIVDEFTGRLMPGRRWSEGLHQAIEAKEHVFGSPSVEVRPESVTLATVTFQNLFRKYKKLSGMTGTGQTSAEEFDKVYKVDVVSIPTNQPVQRKDVSDKIFKSEQGKLKALLREIKNRHGKKQPILVGTRSIDKSEYLGKMLEVEGIRHQILNAKNHEKEAQIIAQAGSPGAVTIATNMAGRGVDIILGGNPPKEEDAKTVKDSGGLYVIGTERHEARRIDNQLRGRSGRQGDPGESCFFVSLEDDLMRIFGGEAVKNMMESLKFPEDEPIESSLISKSIESAQSKVEAANFDSRKYLLEYDDVMNAHREYFYRKRRKTVEANLEDLVKDLIEIGGKAGVDSKIIDEKISQIEESKRLFTVRFVYLKVMDSLWIEHLETMHHLRESVGIRAFGQLDPIIEYKREGKQAFDRLVNTMSASILDSFLAIKTALKEEEAKTEMEEAKNIFQGSPEPKKFNNIKGFEGVNRNDPCPCGSGKKFKKCHGA